MRPILHFGLKPSIVETQSGSIVNFPIYMSSYEFSAMILSLIALTSNLPESGLKI